MNYTKESKKKAKYIISVKSGDEREYYTGNRVLSEMGRFSIFSNDISKAKIYDYKRQAVKEFEKLKKMYDNIYGSVSFLKV